MLAISNGPCVCSENPEARQGNIDERSREGSVPNAEGSTPHGNGSAEHGSKGLGSKECNVGWSGYSFIIST